MVMKNKLKKHNVSKATILMRKISLTVLSFSSVIAIVAIPTYINIKNQVEINERNDSVIKSVEDTLNSNE